LGITGAVKWFLSDQVVPVALVDSSVTLNASSSTPLVNVPATAQEQIAPAANFRLANTGALPAGAYTMVFWLGTKESNEFRIRRRNAADTADVWTFRFSTGATQGPGFVNVGLRLILAVNEFVVIENVQAGGAGSPYQASIFVNAG
jgi:hypothetical protein